jgi:hypothetical protein
MRIAFAEVPTPNQQVCGNRREQAACEINRLPTPITLQRSATLWESCKPHAINRLPSGNVV